MKRLFRILPNIATAISLMLLTAAIAFWIRSYQYRHQFQYEGVPFQSTYHNMVACWQFEIESDSGGIEFGHYRHSYFAPFAGWTYSWYSAYGYPGLEVFDSSGIYPPPTFANRLGFDWRADHGDSWNDENVVAWFVVIPYWLVAVVFGLLPALWCIRWRRRRKRWRRNIDNRCLQCGYDLRASPEDQSRYPLNYESRIGSDRGY